MLDQNKQHRSLSEISHLFLSSVRQRQTAGAARPQRKPPTYQPVAAAAPKAESVDLTPEELQEVVAGASAEQLVRVPPVRALLASHLGTSQLEHASRYARHVAAMGRRVGLIVIDAGELRLTTFDSSANNADKSAATVADCLDARAIREAINELNYDLDLWLLAIVNPRMPEGRKLLRGVGDWVVLCTDDRDGLVACYKAIKGLAENPRPKLSLAVLGARGQADARHAFQKIAGACQQFLDWRIFEEPPVGEAREVAEFDAMRCLGANDKAQLASPAHWQVVHELIEASKNCPVETMELNPQDQPRKHEPEATMPRANQKAESAEQIKPAGTTTEIHAGLAATPMALSGALIPEVIELPDCDDGNDWIIAAVMRQMGGLIECPLRPHVCPEARLAISRERRIILIASAGPGLSQLNPVAQAYRWVSENAGLLAMAMPQFALDAQQPPQLRLLVDQSDLDAQLLSPLLQIQTITLHTYRRVRWGLKNGLLLDAA